MNRLPSCREVIRFFSAATIFCLISVVTVQAQPVAPNPLQGLREFLGPAIRIQKRHTQRLLADPDIVGTAVALTENGEPAIKVFTKSEAIMRIPANLDGMPVEVEAIGGFEAISRPDRALAARTLINPARLFPRPVPIGVSVGNERDCSAGTVGARVVDSSGNVYALSNNHVFALENRAPVGSNIMQPGLANVRCVFTADHSIATLAAYVPIDFSGDNTVDAAIAGSSVSLLDNATPANGYGTPDATIVSAFVGQKVQKYGERSRLTKALVRGINATVLIEYDSGTARFINQIIVGSIPGSSAPFIKAGDSGSLLVTRPGLNPVGLLFAKGKRGRTAVANPIDLVLNAFGVSIDGQ